LTWNIGKIDKPHSLRTLLYRYRPHMRFGHQDNVHQQQQEQLLYQYSCSRCGTILKETKSPIGSSVFHRSSLRKEMCTCCGSVLREQTVEVECKTMMVTAEEIVMQQLQSIASQNNSRCCSRVLTLPIPPSPTFETAYDIQQQQRSSRFTFDIPKIDRVLDLSDRGSICVTRSSNSSSGDGKGYAKRKRKREGCDFDYFCWQANNSLITRLCVRALMSKRYGGLESPSVIFVDAGNCSDIYQCVNFARQYGLDIEKVLESIIVSRPFTIHQLAGLIINDLVQSSAILQRFGAKLVVISDLLRMFIQDPQIDTDESRWLVKEIVKALQKLANHLLVVVSLHKLPSQFCDLLPLFDVCIKIDATTTTTAAVVAAASSQMKKTLQMKISNRRHDSSTYEKIISIIEKDLRIVPVQ
jgi:hypothetical protein